MSEGVVATAGLCGGQARVWENPQDLWWVSQKDILVSGARGRRGSHQG